MPVGPKRSQKKHLGSSGPPNDMARKPGAYGRRTISRYPRRKIVPRVPASPVAAELFLCLAFLLAPAFPAALLRVSRAGSSPSWPLPQSHAQYRETPAPESVACTPGTGLVVAAAPVSPEQPGDSGVALPCSRPCPSPFPPSIPQGNGASTLSGPRPFSLPIQNIKSSRYSVHP